MIRSTFPAGNRCVGQHTARWLLAGVLLAGGARADTTPTEMAVARQQFDAAVKAEDQGRWADARALLEKAIAIKETAGLRYHLGYCKEMQGRLVEALIEYKRAAGLVHAGMTTEDIERFVKPKLVEMEQRVPKLTVRVPGDVKDASLQIDSNQVKPELIGSPIPLNPGSHSVVVFAPGRRAAHIQVTLGEGAQMVQAVELVPELGVVAPDAPKVEAAPAPERTSSSARTWVLVGEGAATVAGLVLGTVYKLNSAAAQSRYDDALARTAGQSCANPSGAIAADCSTLATALDDRDHSSTVSTLGFVGAGLGAVALGATWLFWKGGGDPQTGLRVTPAVTQRQQTLFFTWSY